MKGEDPSGGFRSRVLDEDGLIPSPIDRRGETQ